MLKNNDWSFVYLSILPFKEITIETHLRICRIVSDFGLLRLFAKRLFEPELSQERDAKLRGALEAPSVSSQVVRQGACCQP
jgi:hypothetical protein